MSDEEVLQFYVKVPVRFGEDIRRKLIADGVVDRTLRPKVMDDHLFIPVIKGEDRLLFTKNARQEELCRHEQIGGVVVLQDENILGAEKILAARPSVHTALFATSAVEGEFRTKSFKLLAGEDTTKTIVHEYGKRMEIDLSAAYFSARLANERQRILSMMKEGETILDMFAGVGPFPVMLSPKAELIIANDINPDAVLLMQKNLRLNKITNVIPVLGDAANLSKTLTPLKFDRIIMNLPMNAEKFLETAACLTKPGTVIHLYSLVEKEMQLDEVIAKTFPNVGVSEHMLRSYSPTSWHAVYDIEVFS